MGKTNFSLIYVYSIIMRTFYYIPNLYSLDGGKTCKHWHLFLGRRVIIVEHAYLTMVQQWF